MWSKNTDEIKSNEDPRQQGQQPGDADDRDDGGVDGDMEGVEIDVNSATNTTTAITNTNTNTNSGAAPVAVTATVAVASIAASTADEDGVTTTSISTEDTTRRGPFDLVQEESSNNAGDEDNDEDEEAVEEAEEGQSNNSISQPNIVHSVRTMNGHSLLSLSSIFSAPGLVLPQVTVRATTNDDRSRRSTLEILNEAIEIVNFYEQHSRVVVFAPEEDPASAQDDDGEDDDARGRVQDRGGNGSCGGKEGQSKE